MARERDGGGGFLLPGGDAIRHRIVRNSSRFIHRRCVEFLITDEKQLHLMK